MTFTEPTTVDVAAFDRWIRAFARAAHTHKELLTELDAAIGDADHGANMDRGMTAAVAAVDAAAGFDSVAALLKCVGLTLVGSVGGASGPLYGTLFLRMAAAAGTGAALDAADLARLLTAGLGGVVDRGKAEPGDKTMYDALAPACAALTASLDSGQDLAEALAAAALAADAGRDATVPMLAHKGRASYLGERSIGHQDPGATSVALLVRAAATTLVPAHG
ncbi:MAG TPA: dihydroxyacetone kinase subunit DhaL [Actinotalea sp.]